MAKNTKIELGHCLCTPQKASRRVPIFVACAHENCTHTVVVMSSEALLEAVNDHEAYHAVRSAYRSVVS